MGLSVWEFIDEAGRKSLARINVPDAQTPGNLAPLLDAIRACTNAAVPRYYTKVTGSYVVVPTDGPYTIADKLVLRFRSSLGNLVDVCLPAPIAEIFSDDETVNKENALILTAEAAIRAVLKTVGGEALTEFVGGFRIRRQRS